MKIIFAGTPEFAATHLKALLGSEHDICAVYTQPDRPAGRGRKLMPSPVKALALENNIPIYQPTSFKKDPGALPTLQSHNADLMVVVAYGLILTEAVLNTPKQGCINVHASLLPRWRGAAPIQYSILKGDKETGVTIMQIVKALDAGDMLYKVACDIEPTDTGSSLHDKLAEMGSKALIEALNQFDDLVPEKQDDEETCYAHKLAKAQAEINWKDDAEVIDRQIRAFNSWPVAFTHFNGEVVRVWQASICHPSEKDECHPLAKQERHPPARPEDPGTITNCDKTGITVQTGKGQIKLEVLQLPGGKQLPVADILNGNKLGFEIGKVFT